MVLVVLRGQQFRVVSGAIRTEIHSQSVFVTAPICLIAAAIAGDNRVASNAAAEIVPVGEQFVDLLNSCTLLDLARVVGLHQFTVVGAALVVMDS